MLDSNASRDYFRNLWWRALLCIPVIFLGRELFIRHNPYVAQNIALVALDTIFVSLALVITSYVIAYVATAAYDGPVFLLQMTAYILLLQLLGKTWLTLMKLLQMQGYVSNWPSEIASRFRADAIAWVYGAIEITLLLLWANSLQRRWPKESMTTGKVALLGFVTLLIGLFMLINQGFVTPFLDFFL
jgi:hypothetical protein